MLDSIKNHIQKGEYHDAYIYAMGESVHITLQRKESMPKDTPETIDDEYKETWLRLFDSDPEYIRKNNIMQKLVDLIYNTYFIEIPNDELTIGSKQPSRQLKLAGRDPARDKKIIQEIEKIESELINSDGWKYSEQMLENLRRLVNECRTNDKDYISQLSTLIQAMEDDYSPVLLLGESGVGKSKLAEIYHSLSKRSQKVERLVEVDCGAIPSQQHIYPILFGAKKGSYTDATENIPGKIAEANGGTLFLDEIDRASKEVQNALLRFIRTKKYQPLGYSTDLEADVCIIIGSNKDLKKMVADKSIAPDFYYRISGFVIKIPALRERKNDISLFVDYYLSEENKKFTSEIETTDDTKKLLETYPWFGNLRVLEDYLTRLHRICRNNKEKYLTPYLIKNNPPDFLDQEIVEVKQNLFQNLNKDLEEIFDYWFTHIYPEQSKNVKTEKLKKENKEGFLQQIVIPILGNIYAGMNLQHFDNSQKVKNNKAREVIGIGGLPSGKEPSNIDKAVEAYESLKQLFST